MICAFTGHRPGRLPWGEHEEDPRCDLLKDCLLETVRHLSDKGVNVFLCGMARGSDTLFAEAVLRLQEERPQTELWAVLPCRGQADQWTAADRRRYRRLCGACRHVILIQEAYTPQCMVRRNQWMLERCDVVVSFYDGGKGGTGWMVRQAQLARIPVISLWEIVNDPSETAGPA